MSMVHLAAGAVHVRDIWFDGNEEIVEVGATCPVESCAQPIVTSFTRPGITAKSYQCQHCRTMLQIERPAFSFEEPAGTFQNA